MTGWVEHVPWREHKTPHTEKFRFRYLGGSWVEFFMDKRLIKEMGWKNVHEFLDMKMKTFSRMKPSPTQQSTASAEEGEK